MDVSAFFPSTPQWSNFISVVFQSPLPSYIWNSLLVSVIVVALQIFTGALIWLMPWYFWSLRDETLLFADCNGNLYAAGSSNLYS